MDRSFRSNPDYRHIATYRYLPARALTLGGLFGITEPAEIVLGANFPTDDPVADRKRRQGVPPDAQAGARASNAGSEGHAREQVRALVARQPSARDLAEASLAACSVASISAGPWASDTNAASNCAGGKRHPALQHRVEEPAEPRGVRGLRRGVVGHRALAEEDRQHRAHPVHGHRHPGRRRGRDEAVGEPGAGVLQGVVGPGLGQEVEDRPLPAAMARGFPESVPAW